MEGSNNTRVTLVVVALIIIAAVAALGYRTLNQPSTQTTEVPAQTTENPTEQEETATYKDGTYTATGNYVSPGGEETLGVTITLENGIITSSEVESQAFRPNSVRFQGMFVENYKTQVEGKNIDEVNLTKVSGSSLAPRGFNEALEEIKEQARS